VPQNELSPEQSAGLQSVVSSAREMVARSNNAGTFQNFATQAGGVAPSGNEMQ